MKKIRFTKTVLFAVLFAASMSMNLATVAFTSVAVALSSAFEAVTNISSAVGSLRRQVAGKDQRIASLADEVVEVRERNADLRQEVTEVKRTNANLRQEVDVQNRQISNLQTEADIAKRTNAGLRRELSTQNAKVASLTDEAAALRASKRVSYRGREQPISEAVEDTVKRIGRRSGIMGARSVGSVFAEAIPITGVTAILVLTAWDLKDICDTMVDLRELQNALAPNDQLDEQTKEVCGYAVPTKDEVWATLKASPSMAWSEAMSYLPEVPEVSMQLPDLSTLTLPEIDWSFWN